MPSIVPPKMRCLSGTALKLLACLSMLIDHVGAALVECGWFYGVYDPVEGWLRAVTPLEYQVYRLDVVLRGIGRMAFPVFCFLLVEGLFHTHDVKKYMGRLFLFALLSEIPFDLAFAHTACSFTHQNVYWTLVIGLGVVAGWRRADTAQWTGRLWQVCLLGLGCGAAWLLQTDYSWRGVLMIAGFYLLRRQPLLRAVLGCSLEYTQLPAAALAYLPMALYNGKKGHIGRVGQWLFYGFYPVHLLLLAGIRLAVWGV